MYSLFNDTATTEIFTLSLHDALPISTHGKGRMSLDFLITSLIVVASPGTGVLVTLAAGLSRGTRAAVVAAVGCTLGIVPHIDWKSTRLNSRHANNSYALFCLQIRIKP